MCMEDEHLKTFLKSESVDPNVANKWKMLPKEAYHDHFAKAAQDSHVCPENAHTLRLSQSAPQKTVLLIYNNYLEDESIFLPRNEHDFYSTYNE